MPQSIVPAAKASLGPPTKSGSQQLLVCALAHSLLEIIRHRVSPMANSLECAHVFFKGNFEFS